MLDEKRTIAAISGGLTMSGICIVRMSGAESLQIADKVFYGGRKTPPVTAFQTHTLHHGYIMEDHQAVDEVLLSVMRSPKSYTGEDVVEINCHGGSTAAEKILELLLKSGADLAEPGEFTRRAFLNGRMDLSRAEAVADVIASQNGFSLKASVAQLRGSVEKEVRALRETILDEVALIEAALDDPEHYELTGYEEELKKTLLPMTQRIEKLIETAKDGSVLSAGIRTVIAGRPNAGKSSLLNLLSGHEKAIVTEIPGTTRDVLEVPVRLGELSLLLMDTAGLRASDDPVEKIGIERAEKAIRNADLVLYLADVREGLLKEDEEALSRIREAGIPAILILNKTDLLEEKEGSGAETKEILRAEETAKTLLPDAAVLPFSALTAEGLQALTEEIRRIFHAERFSDGSELVITSVRHRKLFEEALSSLRMAEEGTDAGVSEEFLTVDLTNAYRALGEIIGEETGEDVIDRVFEKFCMGK